jgi:glycosyltransferase involved in cell wall biosynthesis
MTVRTLTHQSVRLAVHGEGAEVCEFRQGHGPVSVSVIVPAHNEAALLPRCLRSLLAQDFDDVMRLIVVDNGSKDGTAEVAGAWAGPFADAGHEIVILKLERGNKSEALNAGDAFAVGKCLVYLDADVELSPRCISEVVDAMSEAGVEMCAPRLQVARSRAWVTRRYARVWTSLPWVRDDAIGGGFYAVSAEGRRRWERFPDVLAEDTFVQSQFRRCERRVVPAAHFLIHLPDGWSDLVRIRTRWLSGVRQLRRQGGEWGRAAFPFSRRIKILLGRPALWPDLPLYVLVNICARWRARRREALGTRIWERGRPAIHDTEDPELAPIGPHD